MKIALLADYYAPFNPGGSEWSVFYLAKSLKEKNIESVILTPNYGAVDEEVVSGIRVIRLPMYKKTKLTRSVINPIWQNNPFFFIWSAFWISKVVNKDKLDVLHVQGKFLIPGAVIAGKITRTPVVVTIRDKQLICSYGKCFYEKGRYKSCGWIEYLTSDFSWYFNHYVINKNLYNLLYNFFAAIWTRMAHDFIRFFAVRATKVITISKVQKRYMEVNGFKGVSVIYNSAIFPKQTNMKRNGILFVGKLSFGKGIYQLLEAIPNVINNHKEIFYFAGGIDEKLKIMTMIKKLKIGKYVKLLGGVEHKKLSKLYRRAKLVVMPSIYPESFGRVALESLVMGTPVVVSDMGGLPEVIGDSKAGIVTEITPENLSKAINEVLDNNEVYVRRVRSQRNNLIKKFYVEPIQKHVSLYKSLAS